MKVVLYGNDTLLRKLQKALVEAGIEAVVVDGQLENVAGIDPASLCIIDATAPQATLACDYAKKTWGIPAILLLGFGEDGWRKVDELQADGYLPRTAGRNEVVARLRAIGRRAKKVAAR